MERRVLSIFLGSPSDLADERLAVRRAIDRINKTIGRKIGWQIDLYGWEDAIPGYGRPQELINGEVNSCDLFIGCLWRRWGTPTKKFSSGFEEEFELAVTRRRQDNVPDIWLYLKEIDESSLRDPGDQLKQVLTFRRTVQDSRELLFKEFTSTQEFGELIHDALSAYLLELELRLRQQSPDSQAPPPVAASSSTSVARSESNWGTLFARVAEVQGSDGDGLELEDKARLLLTASAWTAKEYGIRLGGAHEINLAYRFSANWQLSKAEKRFILRAMLADASTVIPGWRLMDSQGESSVPVNTLVSMALGDSEESVRLGSLDLLLALPEISVSELLDLALADDSSKVVVKALGLVQRAPLTADAEKVFESLLTSSTAEVRSEALRVQVERLLPRDAAAAIRLLADTQVKMPEAMENAMLQGSVQFEQSDLENIARKGHASSRRVAVEILSRTNQLSIELARELLKDTDSAVRRTAVLFLMEKGKRFTRAKLHELFPQPRGLLALASDDWIDPDELIAEQMRRLSLPELTEEARLSSADAPIAFKEWASRDFASKAEFVRAAARDVFSHLWVEEQERLLEHWGADIGQKVIATWQPSMNSRRLAMRDAALQALAEHGDSQDLAIARTVLQEVASGETPGFGVVNIIQRFGDESDIPLILQYAEAAYGDDRKRAFAIALGLSKDQIRLLRDIAGKPGAAALQHVAVRHMKALGSQNFVDEAMTLLQHSSDSVRIGAVDILVEALDAKVAREILEGYVNKPTYFYNVVTWLDRALFAPISLREVFRKRLARAY